MSILSLEFLLLGALAIVVYYALPLAIRWVALLVASWVFVAFAGLQTALHLAAVALILWGGGLGLSKLSKGRGRKGLLFLLLAMDLGAMMLLKIQPVFAGLQNLSSFDLVVPLGLSYFTFQSAGYLVDVYRGKAEAQKNPLKAWLFIGYYPQLAQGPISTWKDIGGQLLEGHRLEPALFLSGFQWLLWGYLKKLVIADRLAATTEALLAEGVLPGWLAVGGVMLYTLRLYMDFSGGMDVVRGFSRMLGLSLPENFRRPFFAQSVADYWRRWHITLGAWFRSYVLYPLTTSRAGLALSLQASKTLGKKAGRVLPSALSTLLVFLLIGLWHSFSWNAVIYGAYFGVVMGGSMLLEPLWKKARRLVKGFPLAPLRLVRTWLLILLAQYFAFTESPAKSLSLLRQSFVGWDFTGFAERVWAIMPPLEWGIAGLGALAVLIVDLCAEREADVCGALARSHLWVRWPLLLLLLMAILIFGIYGSGYDPKAFLYTQF